MLILKGLAVDEEAAVVVEVKRVSVPVWGGLRSGWAGLPCVVRLNGWPDGRRARNAAAFSCLAE